MPAHHVGSLDSWLESPSSSCGLGRPLLQVCQNRPRPFLGGSSQSVPAEDCAVSLGTINSGNSVPRDGGKPASTFTVVDVPDSPLIPSVGNDKHLDGPGTYIVVSHGASSFKRKSLLSEQLRSATSLPLPISVSSTVDADDVALETNNSGTSWNACARQQSTVEQPETVFCGSQLAPLTSGLSTTSAKRQTSILSVYHRVSQGSDQISMLKTSKIGADAPPPCPSAASPCSDVCGSGCGSGDTVSYRGEGGIRVSSQGKSLLVFMSPGSMDADASSACGGGGSLACSSSTGYFSSSSNVLQCCRGDRDDGSNEPLYMQLSSSALMAAAACTGAGADTCMASLASLGGHTTATLRALSAEQQESFGDNLLERAVLAAVPTPASLPLEGTPVIASPLIAALSSVTSETPVPTIVTLCAPDTNGNTDRDVSEDNAHSCIKSPVVCSATDLILDGPSCSGGKKRPSTAIQLAVAAHMAAGCSLTKVVDINNAAIVAGQRDTVTPCMANAADAAPSCIEVADASSFSLLRPATTCAAAAALPDPAADLQGPMENRVAMMASAVAGHGATATTVPVVSAVMAHRLGGVERRGATAAAVAPEPSCSEAELRTPIPSADPATEGLGNSAPQSKPHLELPGEERAKLSMEQLAGQPGGGLPAESEVSRRGHKKVSLSTLFPTVLLVPVTHSFGGDGHAAHLYSTAGHQLQHSMSLDCRTIGAGTWGVEDAVEPTAGIDVCLGDVVNARRSFDVSKALSRTRSSGASGSRGSINGLLEADVDPAMYEGTVRRGLPRKAAAAARTMSQPIPESVNE